VSIPETRETVTGQGFTTRLTWAQLRSSFSTWALIPVVALYVVLGITLLNAIEGGAEFAFTLAAIAIFLVLVLAVLFFWTKRLTDRVTPVGTRYAVALGDESMVVTVGPISNEMPYSSYSRVRRRGGFVLLRLRSVGQTVFLPEELFPGGDFDVLVAAVANPAAAAAAQVLPGGPAAGFDREYVTDPGFSTRLARSQTLWLFTRGPLVVILGIITLVGLLLLLVGCLGLLLAATGTSPLEEVLPVLAGAVVVLGFSAATVLGSFLLIRRQFRRTAPVGSIYGLGLGAATLRLRGPINSADLQYSLYRRARRRGQFVELTGVRGVARVVLPAQLLPDAELDRLNELLQAARKGQPYS
jgi:hypothetical protein